MRSMSVKGERTLNWSRLCRRAKGVDARKFLILCDLRSIASLSHSTQTTLRLAEDLQMQIVTIKTGL